MDNLKQQLLLAAKSGDFLSKATEFYFVEKYNVSLELAKLHNNRTLNVIAEFQKLNRTDQQHDFFTAIHLLEAVLPSISEPVADVMECIKHLTLETGDDMMAGNLISPFIDYMSADAGRPKEALNIALKEIDPQFDFITLALLAGTKLNLTEYAPQAIELCQHPNIDIRIRATHALGRIQYSENLPLLSDAMAAIEFSISAEFDEMLFASALRSSYSLYSQDNTTEPRILAAFKIILEHHEDNILHTASKILNSKSNIPEPLVDVLACTDTYKTNQQRHTG